MADILISNVLAHLPESTPGTDRQGRVRHDIEIKNDRIVDIRPASGPIAQKKGVIDGSRLFATPGFINGHHHSHENFQKGRYESLPLELWMNLVRPMKPVPVTPEQVYLRTMIGAIQALRSGTTTIVDDLNVPGLDTALLDAAFRAYDDIGIRAYVGMTMFDKPFFRGVPFVDEVFPPDLLAELDALPVPSAENILALARKLATTRHPSGNRVAFIAAPSAPQRCTEAFLRDVRALANEHDLPVIIHVQETRLQVVTGQAFFGSTMIEYLHQIGFLAPKTSIIHGVWVSSADLERIAQSGASIQHNPNSNLKLGSGLAPIREMLRRGINVSLGTDGCGSIDSVDMLRVLANAALLQKLRDDPHDDWVNADEAFAAATRGGAVALGRDDLGELRVGAKADIALYDTHSIAMTPLNHPVRQLTYSETGQGLAHLFVDGREVLRAGDLTQIDEAAIIARIHAAAEELEPAIQAAEETVARIRAPYETIYRKCCDTPISPEILSTKLTRNT